MSTDPDPGAGNVAEPATNPPTGEPGQPSEVADHDLVTRVLGLGGTSQELLARVAGLENQAEQARQFLGRLNELDLPAWVEAARAAATGVLEEPSQGPGQPGPEPGAAVDTGGEADEAAPPVFDVRVLVAWVGANVAKVVARKLPQSSSPHWCRQWYHHPEAVARLESARRSWLEACLQPIGSGLVVYWEHLDHQLGVLMDETGPFSGCRGGIHASAPVECLGQDEPTEQFYAAFDQAQAMSGAPLVPAGTDTESSPTGVTVSAAPPPGGRIGEHDRQVNGRHVTERGRGR